MSDFEDILIARIDLKRLTPYILDGTTPMASMTPDRQPDKQCRLAIEIVGATISSGLVSVSGSTIETFGFTENETKVGERNWDSISGITLSGIDGGDISIQAVSRTGQNINREVSVYDDLSVRFYMKDGKTLMMTQGQERVAKYKLMFQEDKDIRENDLVYSISGMAGLTRGEISFVRTIYNFDGLVEHIEADLRDL